MSTDSAEFSVSEHSEVYEETEIKEEPSEEEARQAAEAQAAKECQAAEAQAAKEAVEARQAVEEAKARKAEAAAAAYEAQFPEHVRNFNPSTCDIHSVRPYQAVTFDGKQETFFSTEPINGRQPCYIRLIPQLGMVYVASRTDETLVPFTNISAIHLMSERRKEQRAKSAIERPSTPVLRLLRFAALDNA